MRFQALTGSVENFLIQNLQLQRQIKIIESIREFVASFLKWNKLIPEIKKSPGEIIAVSTPEKGQIFDRIITGLPMHEYDFSIREFVACSILV